MNYKNIVLTLTLFLTLSVSAQKNKVLIIGIDGCRPDALIAAQTPNIDKLWRNGAFSFHTKTDEITLSGPCWTSLLTGVWHTKHGILDNKYSVPSKYPHFFQRLKKLNPDIKTASIVHWKPMHSILMPGSADVVKSVKSDATVAELTVEALSNSDLDVIFIQLDDVDHAGHKNGYGPHVPKYIDSIESTDNLVGKIISALEKRDSYKKENWLIMLSTDHGGLKRRHGGTTPQESTSFFIAHGTSVQAKELEKEVAVVDIAVTAMAHLGVPIDPKWDLDGKIQGIRNTQQKNPPDKQ
jgi:predicted AlkP superfamily pyrophosphatase or phosphodiesterase